MDADVNATDADGAPPHGQPLDPVLYHIQLYFTPVLVTLGTLGNCFSILVFFASRKLSKLSSSYYLSALALSDTCCLLTVGASWLDLIDVQVFNKDGLCQLLVYAKYVCSFLSVWFVVAFTIERFVAVNYPLRRPVVCTVSRARGVLAGLTTIGLLMFSPYLFISAPQRLQLDPAINRTVVVCSMVPQWRSLGEVLNHVDFCLALAIPFCLILTLNTCIARTVWKLARVRKNLIHSERHISSSNRRTILTTQRQAPSAGAGTQVKVTEMLLVVSTVFICLNLPAYVIRVWIFVNETIQDDIQVIILQHYFNILFDINFGINFVLYCVSGRNFRTALITLCCGQWRPPVDEAQFTESWGFYYENITLRLVERIRKWYFETKSTTSKVHALQFSPSAGVAEEETSTQPDVKKYELFNFRRT